MGRDFGDTRNFSEEIASDVDQEIRMILDASYKRAQELLLQHEKALHETSQVLFEKETLDQKELDALLEKIEGVKPPAHPERKYATWLKKENADNDDEDEKKSDDPPSSDSDSESSENLEIEKV